MIDAPVLFDTDVLIDAGRGQDEALDALQAAEERLAVSVITEMELVVGCRDKHELQALDQFLERFAVLPISGPASRKAVALMRTYRLSHGLLIPDALIAATAIVREMPLVSKNQRDYRFMEALDLLPYPDPFANSPANG